MPLVAHIDDDTDILKGAVQICSDVATAIAVCDATLMQMNLATIETGPSAQQTCRAKLDEFGFDETYAVVADMMVAAYGSRDKIRALNVLSIRDAAKLLADATDIPDRNDLINGASIVTTAESSEDFMNQLQKLDIAEHPGLVILDLKLNNTGEQSGIDALCAIKNDPRLAAVPVVMFTQYYDEKYIHLGYKNGASSYHLKGGTQFEANLVCLLATWLILAKLPPPGGVE